MNVPIGDDNETFSPKRVGGSRRTHRSGRATEHAPTARIKKGSVELEVYYLARASDGNGPLQL